MMLQELPPAPTPPPVEIDVEAIREMAREAANAALRREPAPMVQFSDPPMPPEYELAMMIVLALCITLAVVAIGIPIARAFARRLDRKTDEPRLTGGLDARFTQLEQAVEAVAIEVERISEAQRYSAKLLSERLPALPERRGGAAG